MAKSSCFSLFSLFFITLSGPLFALPLVIKTGETKSYTVPSGTLRYFPVKFEETECTDTFQEGYKTKGLDITDLRSNGPNIPKNISLPHNDFDRILNYLKKPQDGIIDTGPETFFDCGYFLHYVKNWKMENKGHKNCPIYRKVFLNINGTTESALKQGDAIGFCQTNQQGQATSSSHLAYCIYPGDKDKPGLYLSKWGSMGVFFTDLKTMTDASYDH